MPVQIMTPQEIISAIQAGTPYYAPRCGKEVIHNGKIKDEAN